MMLGGMDLPIVAISSSTLSDSMSNAAAAAAVPSQITPEQRFKSDIAASESEFFHIVASALAISTTLDHSGKSKDIVQRLANWKRLIETGTEDSKKVNKARLSTLLNIIKESVNRNFDEEEKNM